MLPGDEHYVGGGGNLRGLQATDAQKIRELLLHERAQRAAA